MKKRKKPDVEYLRITQTGVFSSGASFVYRIKMRVLIWWKKILDKTQSYKKSYCCSRHSTPCSRVQV
jgi:hypothetical protein